MLVKNIGPRAWYWPFTESGEPDRVEPGELYELDVSSPRRQPGESIEEYRKRRDDVIEHGPRASDCSAPCAIAGSWVQANHHHRPRPCIKSWC